MLKNGVEIADRFSLTRRLGGADEIPVWEAVDRKSNARVVLKLQRTTDAPSGLEAEYRVRSGLEHPGIAKPLELIRATDFICVVTELAPSGDLGTLRGRPYGKFLGYLQQVAEALRFLHASGWVYGDLKPANVLIDSAGRAQLSDFGSLLAIGGERRADAPVSPYSASPQQRAARPAQPSDDIFSFGALLCEMLSGQPPGYAASEPGAPSLAAGGGSVAPAPQRLIDLMNRCLQAAPENRPASMQEITDELGAVAASSAPAPPVPPSLTPPKSAAEILRPTWQRSTAAAPPDPKQLQRQGFRSGVVVAVVSVMALVAIALFVVPIHRSAVTAPPSAQQAAPATPPAAPETQQAAIDLQTLAQQKSSADEQRASVASRLAALKSRGSDSWAHAQTAAAEAGLAAADALMEQREYAAAQSRLGGLAGDLSGLEAQREPAFKALMQQGEAALQRGDSKSAAAAFAQALAIKPSDTAAQRGARRAGSLDAVFAQNSAARILEQQGRLSEAATAYRKALALDPFDPQAQAGAARTGAQLQADQFGRAMSKAYAAINAHQETAARAAIDEARGLKPNDPEIARAMSQLTAMSSATQLSAALTQAHAAEASENWQEAASQYQRALALDATLVDVRRALQVAVNRAALAGELEQIIAHPERTYSDAVYAAARASLQRAQAISTPGPVLARQIGQVSTLLDQAGTPVNVTLHSDNLTTVTVYRIGDLGSFTQRALQLKPGRYVVVGTRSGFRDVRRQLDIAPGAAPPELVIQCVDPI